MTYKAWLGMKSIPKLYKRDLQAQQIWRVCDLFIPIIIFGIVPTLLRGNVVWCDDDRRRSVRGNVPTQERGNDKR